MDTLGAVRCEFLRHGRISADLGSRPELGMGAKAQLGLPPHSGVCCGAFARPTSAKELLGDWTRRLRPMRTGVRSTRMRRSLPLLLFALTGLVGWALIWRVPDRPNNDEPEPEAPLAPPPIRSADPVVPPRRSAGTSDVGSDVGSVGPTLAKAATGTSRRRAGGVPPSGDEPAPEAILDLPPHLRDADDGAKSRHYAELLSHNLVLLDYAQRDLAVTRRQAPAEQVRKQEQEMRVLSDHLETQNQLLKDEIERLGGTP